MSNHIANKIEATDKSLEKVFLQERYKIDVFQREYRWQRKQIEALISDLSISFLGNYKDGDSIDKYDTYDSYYMGPIVLCKHEGSLSIVDGQQRLTSFTLLLIYLNHSQQNLALPNNLKKDLERYIYVTKGGWTSLVLDIDTREKIIEHLFRNSDIVFEEETTDESVQNIIDRYEDITKLFPQEINNIDVLPLFIEWLLDKIVLVEVKAYSMENAYTIFETMNDRGLNLSPTEMLKGYLLSKITDVDKSYELNEFWKDRITEIKGETGSEGDLDFFKAWLRAKYAESKRSTKQGSENEDFEIIGTQFHAWIKKNSEKTGLLTSEDYYFFLRSDFDFYSLIYLQIYDYRHSMFEDLDMIYISNFYTIADSLAYPLFLSPITKLDDDQITNEKIKIVGNFIDVYINIRTLSGKAITQSSIRNSMYELIKNIRNANVQELKETFTAELTKSTERPNSSFSIFHRMDNWGYYHYFFARILYEVSDEENFPDLLRSKKQSSLVLVRIFQNEEIEEETDETTWESLINSVAGYCLIRRNDQERILSKKPQQRLKLLFKTGYLPEMNDINYVETTINNFITTRDFRLRELTNKLWKFNG